MEIFAGLASVFSEPTVLMWIVLGAFVGMIVGAIPGLTSAAAIAMLVPITFYMEPLSSLAFLYVIGKSGRYGGSIAAILFNTPGTAAAAATQIDGFPLSQKGLSSKAMKVATLSSAIGDFIGDILLILFVGLIAKIALMLGPPELFSIYFAAFVVIGSVISDSILKGLASAAFGIVIATIGLDPITGQDRLTFGFYQLTGGVPLVPVIVGMFVFAEVFLQLEKQAQKETTFQSEHNEDKSRNRLKWSEFRPCIPHVIRSSFIGAFIGMLPGLGSSIAAFISYGEGKRRAKNPEKWGTGTLEGVAAPEAANNAVSGPSMAPLLTLGIPGSTIAAILISVFEIHGFQLGPTLFLTSKDIVFNLFAAGLVGIAAYAIIGYYGASYVGQMILLVPTRILYSLIFLTSFVSVYAARSNLFDIWIMMFAGVIGWFMRRNGFSPAAFIIAFVLAGGAEISFRQALRLSDVGVLIFAHRPVAAIFLISGIIVIVLRAMSLTRQHKKVMNISS